MAITVFHPELGRTKTVRFVTNGLLRAGWVVQTGAETPTTESAQVRQKEAEEAGQSEAEGDHDGPDDSEGAVNDA
jgi:hypothetical protein